MKRLISILLVIMVIFSSFTGLQITSNAKDLPSSGSCGTNITYTFDSSTGLLTISGSGEMKNYSNVGSPFYEQKNIKTVNIESGVTSIGSYAFFYCSGLTSITIPNSVTSIGSNALTGCTILTKVNISSIESWCNISFHVNPLRYAHSLYLNGELVTDLVIPNSVTSIGESFEFNTSLTSITIPDSVTSISDNAFYFCHSLTKITVSTKNQVYDSRNNCNAIIKTKTNTLICGCKNTTIPDSVTSIGSNAFYRCSGLTSITIPNSVTSIGDYAFIGCSSLTSATIGNSVTSIGKFAFYGCSSLTSITIPDTVTSIGDYAFRGCSGLKSITIPNSVASIGDYAFFGCSSLTSVIIPDSVTNINGAFVGCSGLTSITIPDSVESIGDYAFSGCSGLTSVTIPNSVTRIGYYAFKDCIGLTSFTIPNSVTFIGNAVFSGCIKLKELIIPYSVRFAEIVSLGTRIEKIAFNDEPTQITDKFKPIFQTLKEFEVPDSVNYIGDAAFKDCKNLTSITVPKSVTRIEYNAFSGCTNLTIRGYKDSYAETFCKWAGIPFEVIEEPHTHEYTDVVTLPTCTEQGYTTHTCECGNVVTDTYVDALGHDYVANIVTPKANAVGYTLHTCSRCGKTFKDNFTNPTGKPAGFKCASRTATAEKFTWTKTSGVSGYQIQLLNSAGKSAGTATTTGNAYTFSKLAAGHAYKARVRFYIKAADGKNYYGAWVTINSPTLPKATKVTSATAAKKAFTAKWGKVAGVTGYQLQYATNAKFTKATTKTIKGAAKYSLKVAKLKAGTKYYVRIRAYKTIGGKNYCSTWSAAKAVKTK